MGGLEGVYNQVFGQDGIKAGDFVRSTLGSLQFLIEEKEDGTPEDRAQSPKKLSSGAEKIEIAVGTKLKTSDSKGDRTGLGVRSTEPFNWFGFGKTEQDINKESVELEQNNDSDYVRTVVQAVGQTLSSLGVDVGRLPSSDRKTLEADKHAINELGSEFQSKAEADYVESGLALPSGHITETSLQNGSQV